MTIYLINTKNLKHGRILRSCLFFLLFLFSFNIYSQSIVLINDVTNEPISFAIVKSKDSQFLSNEKGIVEMDTMARSRSIEIIAVGYEKLIKIISPKTDTIKLKQNAERLLPILIVDSSSKTYKTKRLKESKKSGNQIIFANAYIKTKITPKEELQNKVLVGLELQLEKHSGHRRSQKKIYKDTQLKCRLNIIQRDSLKNIVGLFKSDPVVVENGKNQLLKFNFEDAPILMSEPFDIYLENLGKLNGNNKFMESDRFDFLRADITEENGEEYESVSYFPKPIGEENDLIKMNFKHHKSRVLKGDVPYTLNYRFYYK